MIKLLYGSFYSYERLRFTGLNTQNILNTANENGILIKNAVRVDYAVMEADVLWCHVKKLKSLLGENRYKIETVKRKGVVYKAVANKKRLFLWPMLLLAVVSLYVIFSRMWSIEVSGYENIEAIKDTVVSKGMLTWRKDALKLTEEVEKAILESDSDILWNSVEINGSVIEVYIKKDDSVKVEENLMGNIVAQKDCVLRNLIVTSGTAMAQNGQTVSAGQVLIEAKQKFGEAVFDVKAEGKAIASVWYYGSEEIFSENTVHVETGNSVDFYEINLFGKKVFSNQKDSFTNFKEEIKEINTFFLPLKIKKITRSETEEKTVSIDKEQAINEAEKEIINRLKLQLPEKAEVYETKTSVQENDGIIKVSVYIETVENVAIRG